MLYCYIVFSMSPLYYNLPSISVIYVHTAFLKYISEQDHPSPA